MFILPGVKFQVFKIHPQLNMVSKCTFNIDFGTASKLAMKLRAIESETYDKIFRCTGLTKYWQFITDRFGI